MIDLSEKGYNQSTIQEMRRNLFIISVCSILGTFLYIHFKKSTIDKVSENDETRLYFDIEKLLKRVSEDKKNFDPLMIEDVNIKEFLDQLDNENKKWNVSTLSFEEIKCKFILRL